MGEVTEIIELYLQDSGVFEDKVSEIAHSFEENAKNVISPGSVGYDTGHLHDSIQADYTVDGLEGVITGWYGADYGQYWYRWIDGEDFMQVGLEETIAMYG